MVISLTHIILTLIILPLIFLPTIIAIKKDHPYKIPIILINIFGSLVMGLGWFVALVWCFIEPSATSNTFAAASELEKLHELKEKGIITQQEFDARKKTILES
ncbi:MAG: SHOCT domain-containing protein [Gammaproteobacteria bacterium]|nr:SHOCT domain-containing protein [Gammaproteobacteria bacterium]